MDGDHLGAQALGRARWLWGVALLPACFHPRFDRPTCGPSGECPSGLVCTAAGYCEDTSTVDGGAALIDASSDATTAPATDCWGRWLAHDPVVSAPVTINELSTTGTDRDPWVSADGKRIYFARTIAGAGQTSDIYTASRGSVSQPFANVTKLVELSTSTNDELRPALTQDELTLVLSKDIGLGGSFAVQMVVRPDTATAFGSPDTRKVTAISVGGFTQYYDPFLSADGLTLYVAPSTATPGTQHIYVSARGNTGSDFGAPVLVPVINSTAQEADPAVSLDGRVLVFSSTRPGGAGGVDLYYATRNAANQEFTPPVAIPTVNGGASDSDPMLSADGCDLYFSSNRGGGGDFDLYVAHVAK